jgi:hypothetical protein
MDRQREGQDNSSNHRERGDRVFQDRRALTNDSPTQAFGIDLQGVMRTIGRIVLLSAIAALGQSNVAAATACGEVVTIETHDRTATRYALAYPQPAPPQGVRVALVLLVGGGGHPDLDEQGCPRALTGNSLVRSLPLFHGAGFATALVDAPSDHWGEDGLAGFRVAAEHAEDLGKVIADVRTRTKASVWLVGTSRGSISAVNAAATLSGPSAPDGLVLTSALMSGYVGGRKPWVANTVFDLPLEEIRVPVLVVGHAEDKCIRSPPDLMADITARTRGVREQIVTVSGGPGWSGSPGIGACVGRAPHGFVGQEVEVAAGIARFVDGTAY